ncbi:MAG: superinfection immunity protein [Alphaproteobacteria bacterium]|nr:superinfection immunity protein [Alphaproteobacteria bacterium]
MISIAKILLGLKYIAVIGILVCIILTPMYLASANNRSKFDQMRVRMGSVMFGWSFIGWIFALFISAKK